MPGIHCYAHYFLILYQYSLYHISLDFLINWKEAGLVPSCIVSLLFLSGFFTCLLRMCISVSFMTQIHILVWSCGYWWVAHASVDGPILVHTWRTLTGLDWLFLFLKQRKEEDVKLGRRCWGRSEGQKWRMNVITVHCIHTQNSQRMKDLDSSFQGQFCVDFHQEAFLSFSSKGQMLPRHLSGHSNHGQETCLLVMAISYQIPLLKQKFLGSGVRDLTCLLLKSLPLSKGQTSGNLYIFME